MKPDRNITLLELLAKIAVSGSIMLYIALISLDIETDDCESGQTNVRIKFNPSASSEWIIGAGFLALGNISGWAVDPSKIKEAIGGSNKSESD